VGTHVALPELIVPRATRSLPVASSPPPDLFTEFTGNDNAEDPPAQSEQQDIEITDSWVDEKPVKKRGRDRNRKKQRLTIKVPAPTHATDVAEEDTEIYCTCRRPSFGEVSSSPCSCCQ